ncbi:DEAD/DEAH box helicase [Nitrospiraceae bacterium HYJII51-Mn-bac16s-1-B09]|uniref:DEAD/DEAH box helicase n=2 Tax=Candidatus Manganitrophus noduliformans TaxID=2606439 RepID=A0A7X6IA06_9BACT|nr:DEAD/DEAH box helicase [Candidatus Manganitrophus noduliformans]
MGGRRGMNLSLFENPSPPKLPLRPYQEECLQAIRKAKEEGKNRLLVSLPTGGGKTVIFSRLPSHLEEKRKTLVLAHRDELIGQARRKFIASNPEMFVEIEQADHYSTPFAQAVIASVATLGPERAAKRRGRFWPEQYGIIITDECHHAAAKTYQNIYEHFGLPDRKDILHVGFTATPKRGDGAGLGGIYEEIVYHKDIGEMIDEGWLVEIKGRRVSTSTDLSRVRSSMGDFQENELAEAVNNDNRNALVVKSYLEFAEGKRCLVFAVDTAHTIALRDTFLAAGIPTAAVIGTTDVEKERPQIYADFAAGRIKVIVNCMVLTEGYDEPTVEAIIQARPTKSSLLYTQIIGRGLRLSPETGKTHCLVIDLVDNSTKNSVKTIPSLFGLPANLDLKGGEVRAAEKKIKAFIKEHPMSKTAVDPESLTDLDQLEIQSQEIDFFAPPKLSDEVLENSKLTWISRYGGWTMSCGAGREAKIEKDILGHYTVTIHDEGRLMVDQKEKSMGCAFQAADRYVREFWPDALNLLRQNAGWKSAPATDAQLNILRRMRIPFPANITKGAASLLIGQKIASRG